MSISPIVQIINEIIKQQTDSGIALNKHQIERKLPGKVEKRNYFYLFSYREDFNTLWGYDHNQKFNGIQDICDSDTGLCFRTILVWDGYPEKSGPVGNIPIQNWVTPVDWAVCAALEARKQSHKAKQLPNWSLLIVDLASQSYVGSQALNLIKHNPAILPWVRIYTPAVERGQQFEAARELIRDDPHSYADFRASLKDDFTTLLEDVVKPERVTGLNSCLDTLDTIADIWSSNIVRPGDRHKVANMIAPLILFSSIKNWDAPADTMSIEQQIITPDTFALSEELKILELIEMPDGGSHKANVIKEIRNDLASVANCELVLIDDQYQSGYETILKYLIANNASLTAVGNADHILGIIKSRLDNIAQPIRTPGWQSPIFNKPTILMLDLRLWTAAETMSTFYDSVSEAMELYFKKIKEKKGNDVLRTKLSLDWQQVSESIAKNPDDENLLALTILPRLLSILDPFLPIILFTSSSNRETIEAMAPHSNIISNFKKPMPTGYKSKLKPPEYLDALKYSIKRAVELCKMWKVGNSISSLEKRCFLNNQNVSFRDFKNSADGVFNTQDLCADIRQTSSVLIRGEYNLAAMLPILLLEYWYNKKHHKRFHDEKPMEGTTFEKLRDSRNDIAHGANAYFLDDSSSAIRTKAIDNWDNFISLINYTP